MKKLTFFIFVFYVGLSMSFVSCNKGERYSRDPDINDYAIKYLETNQNISRDSLALLDFDLHFSVFNSLTPENKLRIYSEKIDLLQLDPSLNADEKDFLNELKELPTSVYNGEEMIPEIEEWELRAKNDFNWSDQEIYRMVGTWLTFQEKGNILADEGGTDTKKNCNCNYDIGCAFTLENCVKHKCKETSYGCGILSASACYGRCTLKIES